MRHVSEAESFMTSLWSIRAMQQTQNTKSKNLNQCSDPNLEIRVVGWGDGHPDPEISGGGGGTSLQKFFSSLLGLSLV